MFAPSAEPVISGVTVTVTCNQGFELNNDSDSVFTCLDDQTFNPDTEAMCEG